MRQMKIWSDTEYVYRCLADEQRTLAFKAAIEAAVKPGEVVLDVGTGSGIMSMFAAKSGARRVYAVEVGNYLSKVSKQIFRESDFADKIVPLQIEARELRLSMIEKPDVVVCEQVTTGLIGEPEGPVINALKRSEIIDSQTVIIPAAITTSISLVHADFNFYGVELKFPIFVDYFTKSFDKRNEPLSAGKVAHAVRFSEDFDERVVIEETVDVSRAGSVNGVMLTSRTNFTNVADLLGTCVSYCQPVILPLEDLNLDEGSAVRVFIEYEMGGGFDSLSYSATIV
jgi:predicted RNA methylase